jgi:hypothetical protein
MYGQVFLMLALISGTAAQIPSEYAEDITVYHVNPLSDGVIPINMDTANALGDIFFDFRSKVFPIECGPGAPPPSHGSDCKNAEVTAGDLVITKLVLTVDNRFGEYGRCNICVNGSAGGVTPCTDGEYLCSCGYSRHEEKCPKTVGVENVTEHFAPRAGCKQGEKDWECWRNNVCVKTKGIWYSTFASGYCGDGSKPEPAGCTWKVKNLTKLVNKTCSDNTVYNYLETYNQEATKCFSSCADSGLGPARNTSSTCWVKCFYTTLLGPDAGTPGGQVTGVPMEKILAAWEKPFLSSKAAEGGCPSLPPSSLGTCMKFSADGQKATPTNQVCLQDADCSSNSHCNFNFATPVTSKSEVNVVV